MLTKKDWCLSNIWLGLFLIAGQYNHAENKEWQIKVSLI
jgi:hypothetical protein